MALIPVDQIDSVEAAAEAAPNVCTPQLSTSVREALAAWRAGDPDGATVRGRASYRDLNSRGNGEQTHRRIVTPGRVSSEWASDERLPRLGGALASERRATVYGDFPVGALVLDYESSVSHYRAGRAKLRIGLATKRPSDGKLGIEWLEYRTLRSRPVFEVALPDGEKVEIVNDRP